MADPKALDIDAISSTQNSETFTPTKNAVPPNEKDIAHVPRKASFGRRVSEWEALQIAQAGDLETIDAEVEEIEGELQRMDLKSTWFKPLLHFKDPKFFTYLLVGEFHWFSDEGGRERLMCCDL
jgi:hypothetical protein